MSQIPGYDTIALLHEGSRSGIYRARDADGVPVVIKVLKPQSRNPAEEARYRREYEILRHLESVDGVIGVYSLDPLRDTVAIVMEDFGAESLDRVLQARTLGLSEALDLAIRLTRILGAIHTAGVIHKDLNPSNILYDSATGRVAVVDFGIATLLTCENPSHTVSGGLEGTLAYIAPEQTGRTNRALDFRSDYYSLGVTLFELFTGRLPFPQADPMETVHAHLAKRPPAMHEIREDIPGQLSEIVAKLLEKGADERYQSARGIYMDLEECAHRLHEAVSHDDFQIARHDLPEQFRVSDKLYGRQQEIGRLLAAFERANTGNATLLLVAGYSGVGKTSLVEEVRWPIARRRGFFIRGKFDQFKRNVPYSALVNAFRELVRHLLTGSEEQLGAWRDRILEALGHNGRIITDVIPEVELMIGPQPELETLSAMEAEHRFNRTLQAFIRLFHRPDHPLALFLDDLQWADSGTLKLIELLLGEPETGHLFIIGAYRDNEVPADHPLRRMVERLEHRQCDVEHILVPPLRQEQVVELLNDTLHRNDRPVLDLARLIVEKTGGNPFFVNQFLMTLYQERVLRLEPWQGDGTADTGHRWTWDMAGVERLGITDNVVELMISKLQRLPEATQQALRMAACIGNRFDIVTLSVILERDQSSTYEALLPAIRDGFILTDVSPDLETGEGSRRHPFVTDCRFLHDRVQQAAYALIDEESRQQVHLRIGRLLLSWLDEDARNERVFELADHFDKGAALLDDATERRVVTDLNQSASRKAKAAAAYDSALRYLTNAMTLLPADYVYPRELLDLNRERAELEYLCGNYDQSDRFVDEALRHAHDAIDRAQTLALRVVQYTMLGRHQEAIDTGRRALGPLGIEMPDSGLAEAVSRELDAADHALGNRSIDSLIDAPAMDAEDKAVAMRLLNELTPAAYFHDTRMYSWILAKMANLSLRFGHVPESGKGYTSYGNVLVYERGAYREGYEFGMLGLGLSQRQDHKPYICRCCFVLTSFLVHWVKPIQEGAPLGDEGYRAGVESGEMLYAGYILAFNDVMNPFFQGRNLVALSEALTQRRPFVERTNNRLALDMMDAFASAIGHLASDDADYPDVAVHHAETSSTVIGIRHVLKALLLLLDGQPHAALRCCRDAEDHSSFLAGTLGQAALTYYRALALTGCETPESADEGVDPQLDLEDCLEQLRRWSTVCPQNFEHQYQLVRAEKARLAGEHEQALEHYRRAIETAAQNGFIQDEAMANELAGRFLAAGGQRDLALAHIDHALDGYRAWGAGRKVAALRKQRQELTRERRPAAQTAAPGPGDRTSGPTSSIGEDLDLTAVIRASQAISGEIVQERLIDRLMDIVIESAGAERACLILQKGDRLVVEAEAGTGDGVRYPEAWIGETDAVATSIANYVARTKEDLVLDDAGTDDLFFRDEYVQKYSPRSVLCIPILQHGTLSGLLYLENNQSTAAFTSGRVQLLKTIASQAAISLENARFYSTLEESERKYRSLYENAVEGIFRTTLDGRILNVNPAMASILGYPSPEALLAAVGNVIKDIYVDPEERDTIIDRLLEHGSVFDFETRFKRPDGTTTWVSISARLERDAAGSVRHIEGFMLGIDERKQKEKAERERKEAEVASEAKSRFLSSMSHEIRTPMNAIIGLTAMVLNTELTPKQRDYLRKVQSSSHALLGIINDILDVSKIEAGKMELEEVEFQLDQVMGNVCDMVGMSAEDKGIELLFDISPEIPATLVGDPLRLGQVLLNLANNAVKFTEKGEILVTAHPVEGERVDERILLHFRVRDTGIGMNKAQIDRIFQSFSQADSSTTRKYGGTGLGLAICKNLVEMMGGEIGVTSAPGGGSEFAFTARFGLGADAVSHVPSSPPDLKGKRVLVVDDSATSRQILREVLGSFGFEVEMAASGQEALNALHAVSPTERPYDLVMMDWNMPGMDGIEATRRIRTDDRLQKMPAVLMVSAYGREEVIRRAERAGVDGFLLKPFYPSILFDNIISILGSGDAGRQPSATARGKPDRTAQFNGSRVLLVEDHEINQLVASNLLEGMGLSVAIANNGREAVDAVTASADRFGAVFMDLQMPEMDGYEACRRIRRDPRFKDLPIIAMTAHAMEEERDRCLREGMDDHIGKPIDPAVLFSVVSKWITPRSSREESGEETKAHALPDMPGISIESAMRHVAGDERLLRRLLAMLAEEYADADIRLGDLLRRNKRTEAQRLAHTMKGVAGQVGAEGLSAKAQAIEAALVGDEGQVTDELLAGFGADLGTVIDSIKRLGVGRQDAMPGAPGGGDPWNLERSELGGFCGELAELIQDDLAAALDLIERVAVPPEDGPLQGAVTELRQALEDFDTDTAQAKLHQLQALGD